MAKSTQEAHRPGVFKKPPKPHKTGRHRSKGAIANSAGGKVTVKQKTKHVKKELSKVAKRHQMMQNRTNQRNKFLDEKRKLSGKNSSPMLIAVVALQEDLDAHKIVDMLSKADEEATIKNGDNTTHISVPSLKQRFSIVVPPQGDLFATLDLIKVVNTVLFVTSATYESDKSRREEVIDSWGEQVVQSVAAQGLPTPILAVTNLKNLPETKRQAHKNHIQKILFKWLPEEKVMDLNDTNAINILRTAASQKQKTVIYRNKRSYLLAEDIKFHLDDNDDKKNFGTLEVSGYLHGMPLSVYGLVHIPGLGDYQMSKIMKLEDPFPLVRKSKKSNTDVEMDKTNTVEKIFNIEDSSKQESLESENIPDPMDAEQTWPTEEELAEAKAQQKQVVKLVPKGTSAYQAAWIPDEEGLDYDESSDDEEKMVVDQAQSEINSDDENTLTEDDKEEYETMSLSDTNEQRYDEKMDLYKEKEALLKLKEAKQDSEFPDEVDTPQDILAKVRFQKYRGLDSFRTTFWDRLENLPYDYGRIFQFQNFDRTRRRVAQQREDLLNEEEHAQPGSYLTISVKGVSKELYDSQVLKDNLPLVVFGLLEYEHRMSVLNFVLNRTLNSNLPIKSKERLIFQCGFRRFSACPIFSQHTNGNKHKYERFFQPNSTVVATTFAPITFPPCPVLCYMQKTDGSLEMIATGSLMSVNPNRLIIKRVILSGHPFKVHKKSAVVRFMFFNREDIRWFKPVKLRTKCGRKGHIKEPLGTHGHMKCIFDGPLKSQDTVLMNLYKRVFPKWTYEPALMTIGSGEEPADKSTDVQME
ncbi:pre-rRNA-processing protein TSR1 homolog [Copidosoma floridanum]|uniref:pre-rRNA-processing protein TSR1 homolog n=1 Tax=Copidosoma floridanum TaxID=29053 RepID=UPI0006C981A0|nr:pre-rRNA-processing protein TSR1 homolog [Copidosoma floridanum]